MAIVNFCLNNDTFEKSVNDSLDNIYMRIDNLNSLKKKIDGINKKKKELDLQIDGDYKDKIITDNIHNVNIYKDIKILDFIYGNNALIKKDYRALLRVFIDQSQKLIGDQPIHQYISFSPIKDYIHTEEDLENFYYYHMTLITSMDTFAKRIKIHFPDLEFHQDIDKNLLTMNGTFEGFRSQIIRSLYHLERDMKNCFKRVNRLDLALREFAGIIDLKVTLEGKKKHNFDYDFKTKQGTYKTICCEPHIKMKYSDEGDLTKIHHRIYFHLGDPEIADGKILIGYIGSHP